MVDCSGKQLGNYRLLRPLGKGGFAEVYLGEHIFLKTSVAFKVLYTQLENEDMTSFLGNPDHCASPTCPYCACNRLRPDGELPYLVMDYAPNGRLRDRHPRGTQVPLPAVSAYVKQVAEALQYAHDEKLIPTISSRRNLWPTIVPCYSAILALPPSPSPHAEHIRHCWHCR